MSQSVDVNIYDKEKLLQALRDWGANNDDLTNKILAEFGTFAGDKYILLNNEFYGEFNPYYNLATVMDRAYQHPDSFDVLLDFNNEYSTEGTSSVEVWDVCERLDIPEWEPEEESE